jgi:hypothetical protein
MSSATSYRDFEEYERLVQKILEEKVREEYPSTVIRMFHNAEYRLRPPNRSQHLVAHE